MGSVARLGSVCCQGHPRTDTLSLKNLTVGMTFSHLTDGHCSPKLDPRELQEMQKTKAPHDRISDRPENTCHT